MSCGSFSVLGYAFVLLKPPGVFQQLLSIVPSEMEGFAMTNLEDILVFFQNPEEHFKHLQRVFDWLKEHGLKLKFPMCPSANS